MHLHRNVTTRLSDANRVIGPFGPHVHTDQQAHIGSCLAVLYDMFSSIPSSFCFTVVREKKKERSKYRLRREMKESFSRNNNISSTVVVKVGPKTGP